MDDAMLPPPPPPPAYGGDDGGVVDAPPAPPPPPPMAAGREEMMVPPPLPPTQFDENVTEEATVDEEPAMEGLDGEEAASGLEGGLEDSSMPVPTPPLPAFGPGGDSMLVAMVRSMPEPLSPPAAEEVGELSPTDASATMVDALDATMENTMSQDASADAVDVVVVEESQVVEIVEDGEADEALAEAVGAPDAAGALAEVRKETANLEEAADVVEEGGPAVPVEAADAAEALDAAVPVEAAGAAEALGAPVPVDAADAAEALGAAVPVEAADAAEALSAAVPVEAADEAEALGAAVPIEAADAVEALGAAVPVEAADAVEALGAAVPVEAADAAEALGAAVPVEAADAAEPLEAADPADAADAVDTLGAAEAEEAAGAIGAVVATTALGATEMAERADEKVMSVADDTAVPEGESSAYMSGNTATNTANTSEMTTTPLGATETSDPHAGDDGSIGGVPVSGDLGLSQPSSGEQRLQEMQEKLQEVTEEVKKVESDLKKKESERTSSVTFNSDEPKLRDSRHMPPIVEEPEEEIVLVKTEFVWAEGAMKEVQLCGAWNGWIPQRMFYEGESGFWSIVTPVPLGTHEYKYIVDGKWRTSAVHPIASDGVDKVNIRSVQGKPDPSTYPMMDNSTVNARDEVPKKGCCTIS